MKLEALIYALVACLTLIVPSTAYFVFADKLKLQVNEASKTAQRYEALAKDIEQGRIQIHVESIPAYMRLQAKSENALAEIYSKLGSAHKDLLISMVGVAIVQWIILLAIRRKRMKITSRSTPTPTGAG